MLDFALKVATDSASIEDADFAALLTAGFSMEANVPMNELCDSRSSPVVARIAFTNGNTMNSMTTFEPV